MWGPIKQLSQAKTPYYSSLTHQQQNHPRLVFSTINQLLHPINPPLFSGATDLCNKFLDFFQEKLTPFINSFWHLHINFRTAFPVAHLTPCYFSSFSSVNYSQVTKWVFQSTSSTCTLDPMQTTLVRACLPALCPLTVDINCSLESGVVPSSFKPPQWLLSRCPGQWQFALPWTVYWS